jgi:hypothetical protein
VKVKANEHILVVHSLKVGEVKQDKRLKLCHSESFSEIEFIPAKAVKTFVDFPFTEE